MASVVSAVDVGQGDCTVVVDGATGHALVVDCNAGHHQSAFDELVAQGFAELHAAVVTHSHRDHFGGVLDLLEMLAERFTGRLFFNHDTFVAQPRTLPDGRTSRPILRALLNRAREYEGRVSKADTELDAQSLGEVTWTLLAPSYDQLLAAVAASDPNKGSGIVLIECGGQSVIIGGDAPLETWKSAESGLPSNAAVRWPHHGGSIDSSADAQRVLLEVLDPAVVIVSVGSTNPHGHPTGAFLDAVGSHRARLLCTEATPACCLDGDGGVCAGSVRIRLDGSVPSAVETATADHAAVVGKWGRARCV